MKLLMNFLSGLNEDTRVLRITKNEVSETTVLTLKEVVGYKEGLLVKNFSLLSGRILAGGRLYKILR